MKHKKLGLFFLLILFFILPLAGEDFSQTSDSEGDRLQFSLSSIFEPQIIFNLTDHDDTMEDYLYQPVGSPFLPAWGLQGKFYEASGFTFGMKSLYGFRSILSEGKDKSTTLTLTKTGFLSGYTFDSKFSLMMEAGFASLAQTASSDIDGGAMVYLGPYIQPEVTYYLNFSRWFGELSAGFYLHFPLGEVHNIPLWEESFQHLYLYGFSISFATGFSNGQDTGGKR
jgi:hypothetical protein